ncbi:MAG: hypothetical protein AAF824_06585 [Bacteroidota bacterium]
MQRHQVNRMIYFHLKLVSISQKRYVWGLLLLLGLSFSACEPEDDTVVIPPNQAPVIQRLTPNINKQLLPQNETLSLSFKLADNEKLAKFRLDLQLRLPDGFLIADSLITESNISGTLETVEEDISLAGFPLFSQLVFTATVTDADNEIATDTYELAILSEDLQPPLFKIFSLGDKQLYQEGTDSASIINLTTQRTWNSLNGNRLEMDLAVSNEKGDTFEPQLYSPAAEESGQVGTFLLTSTDTINYDKVTHEVLFRAFTALSDQTQPTVNIQKGELIIIRLTRAPAPQFAVLRIEDIIDEAGSTRDRILFSYKVSSP